MIKIAYTGSHGCGKTTAVFKEAYNKKLENPNKIINILTEASRECPFPINRKSTINSQKWIFYTQLKKELEQEQNCDILICDRTIVDVLAYSDVMNFKEFVYLIYPIVVNHIITYDCIYFLTIKNNDYHYVDGIRDTDLEHRKHIEDRLLYYYETIGKLIPCWNYKFFVI